MTWAEHVGRKFKSFRSVYRCAEYCPRRGLLMVLEDDLDELRGRAKGDSTWIAERAIGRTFYEIHEVPA